MSSNPAPSYISLDEAATKYGVPHDVLIHALEHGTISSIRHRTNILISEGDAIMMSGFTVPIDESLRDVPIRATEAAEKYRVSQANLSRWADAGYIHILERRNKLLILDEADVKRTSEIFKRAMDATGSFVRAGWILKRTILSPIN